jgi:putative peptidoglycan lipid II flippase
LIGTAIAIALLPSLSELIQRGEVQAYRQTINRALRAMLALTLPIAVILSVTIHPLVDAVFSFDQPIELELTVWATRAFLFGLVGHTWLEVGVRSFYAQQNARTPLLAAFLQAVAYLLLATLLSRTVGHTGLALADTITFTAQALLLLALLHRKHGEVLAVGGTLVRAGIGAGVGALAAYALMQILPLPAFFTALAALAAGGLAAVPFIWPELRLLVRL